MVNIGNMAEGDIWDKPSRLYPTDGERSGPSAFKRCSGNTHAFLPEHNGNVPNTAHILLHLATAATSFFREILRSRLLSDAASPLITPDPIEALHFGNTA